MTAVDKVIVDRGERAGWIRMDPSSVQRVGRTDLELPRFGFGTAHLGELYERIEEMVAREALDVAWSEDVRYFDTAPLYGRGLSEHRLGGLLRTKPREAFAVSTKVGRVFHRPADPSSFDRSPWTGGLNFDFAFDYSYDGVMRSYEQSLLRLGLDTVDALIIHDLDVAYHSSDLPEQVSVLTRGGIKALEELKASGDIKAIGMGINREDAFAVAEVVDLDFCMVAMPYTLLDHASVDRGMAHCVERGISVIVGSPFASGILVTGSQSATPHYAYARAPDDVRDRVRALETVCDRHGVPLPAAALQFVLAHPAVCSVIPGAMSAEELRQNLAFMNLPIPHDFWDELRTAGLVHPNAPTPA